MKTRSFIVLKVNISLESPVICDPPVDGKHGDKQPLHPTATKPSSNLFNFPDIFRYYILRLIKLCAISEKLKWSIFGLKYHIYEEPDGVDKICWQPLTAENNEVKFLLSRTVFKILSTGVLIFLNVFSGLKSSVTKLRNLPICNVPKQWHVEYI